MRAWAWIAVVACLIVPRSAHAYRTLTDEPSLADAHGQPIGWTRWPLRFELFQQEGDLVDAAGTLAALEGGIAVWQGSMCAAGALEAGGTTTMPAQIYDGRNTIQWVHTGWSNYGGPEAVAITQTMYQNTAGHYALVDADIYINGERTWDASMLAHLDGVLAHELGHALGLSHPCERRGENGAPVCGNEPTTLMHPSYSPSSFMLTADDEAGACFLYPDAAPRGAVEIEKACTVSAVGAERYAASLPMLLLIGSALLLVRRRARSVS